MYYVMAVNMLVGKEFPDTVSERNGFIKNKEQRECGCCKHRGPGLTS